MTARKKIRIGNLLVEHKVISEDQLLAALDDQKQSGHKLGRILVENGYISEDRLMDFLSRQLQVPYIDLKHYRYNTETARSLPETHARRYRALLLDDKPNKSLVAMADPTDIFGIDEIEKILRRPVTLALVREADLLRTIDIVYRRTEEVSRAQAGAYENSAGADYDLANMLAADTETDKAVLIQLQDLLQNAIQLHASDIHIAPGDGANCIRQRIDGVLQLSTSMDKNSAVALVIKLKQMAGLNINERRLPQDGSIKIRVDDHNINIDLSTLPTEAGESVVLQLHDQNTGLLTLQQLGMPQSIEDDFSRALQHDHGMVLIAGPVGSGKTTTLYAALQLLNQPEKNIITIEDPVRYRLPYINQVRVNTRINLDYTRILRNALNHDPDVLVLSELPDSEIVATTLRAAMSGHQVISAISATNAISAAIHLLDMGVEPYQLAATLHVILAQRLVRRICEHCKVVHTPDSRQQAWLQEMAGETQAPREFSQGSGCVHCNNSGYSGRAGVFELLRMDPELAELLRLNDVENFRRAAASQDGYHPVYIQALEFAGQGITTLDEAIRTSS